LEINNFELTALDNSYFNFASDEKRPKGAKAVSPGHRPGLKR
jgi:hypothetical protein